MFKILVCGGRDYNDYDKVREVLSKIADENSKEYNPNDNWLPSDIMIISGGARGADTLAIDWAIVNYAQFKEYEADWDKHGKAAGPIRNAEMLKEVPDLVVAFPGGKGTLDIVTKAKQAGIKVLEVTNE